MKGMRFTQRTLLQLFDTQPAARLTLRQFQQTPHQQPPTRPLQPFKPTRPSPRSFHTQRTTHPFSQAARQSPRSPRGRRFNSTATNPPPGDEALSLSQRLKKLSREYGWAAVGIYFALSALDFPFCFLAVRTLGTDRIGHWEHVVLSYIKGTLKWPLPQQAQEAIEDGADMVEDVVQEKLDLEKNASKRVLEEGSVAYKQDDSEIEDHGYKEAEAANRGSNASIWTQLALAYAIHKSFIFIRVPLTAAVTPKVVKTLRGWGWNIGKMPKRGARQSIKDSTGVNTKGSKVKDD